MKFDKNLCWNFLNFSKSLEFSIIFTYIVFFLIFFVLSEFVVWQSLKYLAIRNSRAYLEIISYKGNLLLRDDYVDYLMRAKPSKGIFPREMFLLKRSEALEDLETFLKQKQIAFALWFEGEPINCSWPELKGLDIKKMQAVLDQKGYLLKEISFQPFGIRCLLGMSPQQALAPFQKEIQAYLVAGFVFAVLAMGMTFLFYRRLIGLPLQRLAQGLTSGDLPKSIGIREFDTLIQMVQKALEKERRLIESLAVSEKLAALGTLAGGYAHEFNNLLQIIIGNMDVALLACRKKNCQKALQKLATAREAALRGAGLARKILAISRQDSSKVEEACDLGALLEEIAEGLRTALPREVEFVVETRPGLGVPLAAEKLRDIIVNLVSNARDALTKKGTIHLRAYQEGDQVVLEVRDTGMGMDEETLKRIFDPFFTTKEPGKGTGLGLYAVYQLTHLAGGQIDVQSHLGAGTTFKLFFPRVELTEDESKSEPLKLLQELETSSSLRILVVDDEKEILENFYDLLTQSGHKVTLASKAEEAKELLQKQSFDLLFLDLSMPGKGGGWLLNELSNNSRPPKIVIMTGFAGNLEDEIEDLHRSGKIYYILRKPFDWELIQKILREVSS